MSVSCTKEQIQREAWLLYFNRVLYEKGVIGEQEYRRMKAKITAQTQSRGR